MLNKKIVVVLVTLTACSPDSPLTVSRQQSTVEQSGAKNADRSWVSLTSPAAIALAKGASIPVRSKTPALAGTGIAVPILESFTSAEAASLAALVMAGTASGASAPVQKDVDSRIEMRDGARSLWSSKNSRELSYWDEGNPAPLINIQDPVQAVDAALVAVGKMKLLSVAAEETLDLVSLSIVRGAMTEHKTGKLVPVVVDDHAPSLQHIVEYVVTLGRRYRGVPVLGSELKARIGRKGQLRGIYMSWRQIVGEDTMPGAMVTDQSTIEQRAQTASGKGGPVTVKAKACGYLEAPAGQPQQKLLPGCRLQLAGETPALESERSVSISLLAQGASLYGP